MAATVTCADCAWTATYREADSPWKTALELAAAGGKSHVTQTDCTDYAVETHDAPEVAR